MSQVIKAEDLVNGTFGIDRVGLSYRIASITKLDEWGEGRHRAPKSRGWRQHFEIQEYVGGALVTFSWARRPDGSYWASVEFNPSRVIDPDGITICPVDRFREAVDLVLDRADELMTALEPRDLFNVTTLHVTRDFSGVESFAPYVPNFVLTRSRYAKASEIRLDPASGRPETVYHGTETAGRVAIYDKTTESAVAPAGRVRWELQARCDGWLDKTPMTTLAGVTLDNVAPFASYYWDWSGAGTPVVGDDYLIRAVAQLIDDKTGKPWTRARQERLLGFLYKLSRGEGERLPPDLACKYRKAIAVVGYPSCGFLGGEPIQPGSKRYLDFYLGTEVTHDLGLG